MYYFAYGSNLHPIRIEERIGKVEFIATGELRNAEILFNKKGRDNTGKCTIEIQKETKNKVFGVIYKTSDEQESLLDEFESLYEGYDKIEIDVYTKNGKEYNCYTYVAMPEYTDDNLMPFDWYKELVYLGAKYNNFPKKYIRKLKEHPSVPDNDSIRASENKRLIERIIENMDI